MQKVAATAGDDKGLKKTKTPKKTKKAKKDVVKHKSATKKPKKVVVEHQPETSKHVPVAFPDFCDFEFGKFSKAVVGYIADDDDTW